MTYHIFERPLCLGPSNPQTSEEVLVGPSNPQYSKTCTIHVILRIVEHLYLDGIPYQHPHSHVLSIPKPSCQETSNFCEILSLNWAYPSLYVTFLGDSNVCMREGFAFPMYIKTYMQPNSLCPTWDVMPICGCSKLKNPPRKLKKNAWNR